MVFCLYTSAYVFARGVEALAEGAHQHLWRGVRDGVLLIHLGVRLRAPGDDAALAYRLRAPDVLAERAVVRVEVPGQPGRPRLARRGVQRRGGAVAPHVRGRDA